MGTSYVTPRMEEMGFVELSRLERNGSVELPVGSNAIHFNFSNYLTYLKRFTVEI
jgi:hypothetical protein